MYATAYSLVSLAFSILEITRSSDIFVLILWFLLDNSVDVSASFRTIIISDKMFDL